MGKTRQTIIGNYNIQVAGNLVTKKIVHTTEVKYDEAKYITDEQAKTIRDFIMKIASEKTGDKQSYRHTYNSFYNKFKITKYQLLPKDRFEEAIIWLKQQVAMNRSSLKRVDPDKWRKEMYKSIHARANELNINIHDYATEVLNTKTPVLSLTDLSDARLQKLYDKLYSI